MYQRFGGIEFSNFKGDKESEEHTFEKFLCAIFNRPYQPKDAADLATLTELARYYQALLLYPKLFISLRYRDPSFCQKS
jgi:streptomycin 6-kinase